MAGEPIITVVGDLTGDPESRYVSSDTPVAPFTVAPTPRTLNHQTQQWEDREAMFIRCSVWREHDENVVESLNKGMRMLVAGRLTIHNYECNGQQCTGLEMQVDETGPSLRYARAQVTRVAGDGSGGGDFGGGNSYQDDGGYDGGRASYDALQDDSVHDPWNSAPQGDSVFNDDPPF